MAQIQAELDFSGTQLAESKLLQSTRKTVSLPPRQGSSFTSRQQIIVNLPNDQLLDLSEARLEFSVNIVTGTGSVNSFISESAWSPVRVASVYSGGGEELERIDDANVLASALHDMMPPDWKSSTGKMMGINSIANKQASFGGAGVNGRFYSLDLSMLGIFSMPTLFPAFLLGSQMYLQLDLSNDATALTDTTAPAIPPQYNISNVRLILSQVDVGSEFKNAHRELLVQGDTVNLLYDSFQLVPESLDAGQTQKDLKAGFFKSALKGIMVIPRIQANINNTLVNEYERVFDNNQDYQMQLSSVQYPRTPVRLEFSAPTGQAELMKMLALHRSNAGTDLDDNYTTFAGGNGQKFMVGQEIGCRNDGLDPRCGVNSKTNPSAMNITWRLTAAAAANTQFNILGHANQMLEISAGGVRRLD